MTLKTLIERPDRRRLQYHKKCRNHLEWHKKWLFYIHIGKTQPLFQNLDVKVCTLITG